MKSWRDKLQTTLRDVNESSLKLKQQLQQAVQQGPGVDGVFAAATGAAAPAAGAAAGAAAAGRQQQAQPQEQAQQQEEEQQYLRLPVESAKKLRWFDRQDINMLMTLHLREKQELFEANSALRQVLRRQGVGEAALEAEMKLMNSQVDAMRAQEQGVNQVLVIAAQAEVENLKDQLDSAQHELQHMRRQRLQATSSSGQPAAAAAAASAAASAQQQAQQQQQGERVSLQLRCLEPSSSSGGSGGSSADERCIAARLVVHPGAAPSSSSNGSQVSVSLPAALAALAQAAGSGGASSSSSGGSIDPQLLLQAAAALSQLARAQGVQLPGFGSGSLAPTSAAGGGEESSGAAATAAATAAGDSSSGSGSSMQERCNQLELQVGRLQAELATAEQDAAFARDAADRKLQELRNRFAEAQQRQGDMLRLAQDGRLDAESRCEAAERKLQMAEGRCARLDTEAKDLKAEMRKSHQDARRWEKEAASAEARVQQAEAAAGRERLRGAAEVDIKSHEVMGQQRSRIAELEGALSQHQRQLATAHQQAEALEARLAAAELAAAHSAAEVHELEAAIADRDAMAMRLSVLEGRLDETRSERGQAESYRTLAQQSEEKRARAEDELLTTARLAASLEARLAQAARDNDTLRLEAQAATARAHQAQQSVGQLVQERWAAAGADRAAWPLAAQEEIENVEARLRALHAALKEAQLQLAEANAAADAERSGRAAAERRVAAAEDAASRQQREGEQRLQRLEAAASAAAVQVGEFREALAAVERERDQLLAEKEERERASKEAAAAVAAARRRTGSGMMPAAEADAAAAAAAAAVAGLASPGGAGGNGWRYPAAGGGSGDAPPSPLPALKQRDTLESTDVLYLKNVVLKFIDAHISGRSQECEVLLPAVATLLRASPAEYRVLRAHLQRGGSSWLPSLMGS